MLSPATESNAVAAWVRVLDEIQRKLGESLANDAEVRVPAFPVVAKTGSPLQPLDDRLAKLQSRLARADNDAADIDAGLQGEAEVIQKHLDNLRATGQELADWASRAV